MYLMCCFFQDIGWSVNGTSRRLVIFVTDAPFHVAGDGKVGIPVDNLTSDCVDNLVQPCCCWFG